MGSWVGYPFASPFTSNQLQPHFPPNDLRRALQRLDRDAAEHWQSEGQWGKRDFDKAVFNLPIPLYDSKNALHRDLATAAGRAETLAKKVELKDGEHFTRTRRRIRQALIDHGVAGRIEALVARLIGVAPAVSVATDEDDEDGDDAD